MVARIHRRTVQKDRNYLHNYDGMITHLEPDILECGVKWMLESIPVNKASAGDGIPAELFQILKKIMMLKCCMKYASKLGKSRRKRSVFIQIPKKGNAKGCSNYHTIDLTSHAIKVRLKFSKPCFSNMWTMNFLMFKLVLEKAEEPEIKLPTSAGSSKKQESSRKTSISALLAMPKPLTVWITINCGKFIKRWEYQTTLTASGETCI